MPADLKEQKAKARFQMVKQRHSMLFEKARKEGRVDERMVPFIEWAFSRPELFTTSTCSGRLVLLQLNESEEKKPECFFAKWHSIPEFGEVWEALNKKSAGNLWFKQEPFVIVLGTDSLENAKEIMGICRNNGVKKAGIMSAEDGKFLVEIMGSDYVSFLAKEKDKILLSKEELEKQFSTACKKLERSWKMLEKLEKALKKEF